MRPTATRGGLARAGVLGVVALVGTAAVPSARAASSVEPVALSYLAPLGCPDVESFVRRVRAREPRFEPSPLAPRAWEVALVASDGVVEGRLTTRDSSGERATRSFSGATCEEVLGALALVAALALDVGPASRAPPPDPSLEPPPRAAPKEALAPSPAHPLRLGTDVRGIATLAVAPNPLLALAVRVSAEWGGGWLAPAVRAGIAWGESATADFPGGAARFVWSVITLDGCPVRFKAGSFSVAPCARLDVGVLRGVGYIAHPSSVTEAWVDLGVVGEARWVFARPAYATIDAGLLTPLTRVRYHFDNPDTSVHTAAALEGTAGVGLGTYFW